jgi:hypothetical protein
MHRPLFDRAFRASLIHTAKSGLEMKFSVSETVSENASARVEK